MKKPIVKEWCYNPKDLIENAGSFPTDLLNGGESNDDGQDEGEEGGDAAASTPF